jgi:2-keto-4-pentenoate hydratase/2-oxohepta-3-ene-1,7-dioic acid hydratase in catechol pathway
LRGLLPKNVRYPDIFVRIVVLSRSNSWEGGDGWIDLTPEDAAGRIFGVTLLNDFSARDRQFEERRPTSSTAPR